MKYLIFFCVLFALWQVDAKHLVVGNVSNRVQLANHTTITYNAIPFMKRVKYFFYSQLDNRKIQGIQALDNYYSQSSINITAGGVGYPFVNLRMKSERGRGMSYDIGIYVSEDYTHL
ncbi:hypothetical protein K1T71_014269 [Dendrolimus kikuchii]|uniref:Uncharacterized protein n=1 Tax=Dendrolimus kikuchii TaxID=765133 RepID=A0ACC1CFJ7_9NEOP|nr:hypothetical protein K1T71_014269 [Dendrolimus kikuchii]